MATVKELLNALEVTPDLSTAAELKESLLLIDQAQGLSSAAREVLRQFYISGPVFDGDLASKAGRDELESFGMAARCVVKGEQGYNVCLYKGFWALRIVELTHPMGIAKK